MVHFIFTGHSVCFKNNSRMYAYTYRWLLERTLTLHESGTRQILTLHLRSTWWNKQIRKTARVYIKTCVLQWPDINLLNKATQIPAYESNPLCRVSKVTRCLLNWMTCINWWGICHVALQNKTTRMQENCILASIYHYRPNDDSSQQACIHIITPNWIRQLSPWPSFSICFKMFQQCTN